MAAELSADEIQQYDRQLRLWGLTAQTRLRDARVLLVNIGGLGAEIAKNLVLAGIGSLTLLDTHLVVLSDLGSQFFLTAESEGQNRAMASLEGVRLLNPRVNVRAECEPLTSHGPSYFGSFDVVCLTECDFALQCQVNSVCRAQDHRILFFGADTFGWYGSFHEDLSTHQFTVSETKEEVVTKSEHTKVYPSLEELARLSPDAISSCFKGRNKAAGVLYLALRAVQAFHAAHDRLPLSEDDRTLCLQGASESVRAKLAEILPVVGLKLNPVCAIFGGVLSSEILKAISGQDEPWNNTMTFDGQTSECTTVMIN